jgi:hypothetical protein
MAVGCSSYGSIMADNIMIWPTESITKATKAGVYKAIKICGKVI